MRKIKDIVLLVVILWPCSLIGTPAVEEKPNIKTVRCEIPVMIGAPPPTVELEAKPVPEYPEAEEVWDFLKESGYSDNVAAGIMGNMMAECGGQTFHLQTEIYGEGFYGICQWSEHFFPEVQGMPLREQLAFLHETIPSQFGSHLEDFVASKTAREAARRFAVWYERCDPSTYGVRQNNADKAYKYFVKEMEAGNETR